MKKVHFLILCHDQLKSYLFEAAFQQVAPEITVLKAVDTDNAMGVLETIARLRLCPANKQSEEIRILLDMKMPFLEAFVFLHELYQHKFPFPVRVYLLEDATQPPEGRPDISRYKGIRCLGEGSFLGTAEHVVKDKITEYFQHNKTARFPVFIN